MTEACRVQVRYDRQVSGDTAVKFMTDGILLRELQSDLLLRSYSILVLDEAHERSLNTDLLLGMPNSHSGIVLLFRVSYYYPGIMFLLLLSAAGPHGPFDADG